MSQSLSQAGEWGGAGLPGASALLAARTGPGRPYQNAAGAGAAYPLPSWGAAPAGGGSSAPEEAAGVKAMAPLPLPAAAAAVIGGVPTDAFLALSPQQRTLIDGLCGDVLAAKQALLPFSAKLLLRCRTMHGLRLGYTKVCARARTRVCVWCAWLRVMMGAVVGRLAARQLSRGAGPAGSVPRQQRARGNAVPKRPSAAAGGLHHACCMRRCGPS